MSYKVFSSKSLLVMTIALAMFQTTKVDAALVSYSENFESLIPTSSTALSDAGFLIYSNSYSDQGLTTMLTSAGSSAAQNDYRAFSQVVTGQGGLDQGAQQLLVYSNYLSRDQSGLFVDALTLQQQTIGAADIGTTWSFSFDAKQGDITGSSRASAWIRAVDAGITLGEDLLDTTSLGFNWDKYVVSLYIDTAWEGKTLEFGVRSAATGYTMSGVYYDNFYLAQIADASVVPVPAAVWLFSSGLLGLIGMARRGTSHN